MQAIDQNFVLFLQSIRCEALTNLFCILIPLEFWNLVAIALVLLYFYQTGILRVPVISFFLARGLSDLSYEVIKNMVHRPRPFVTIKGLIPVIAPHGFSFPSGHATLAMAMAVVLSFHFPKARGLVFAFAVLVGFSRVYFGVHYLSDVLAGFGLGAAVGYLCILLERAILTVNKGVEINKSSGK